MTEQSAPNVDGVPIQVGDVWRDDCGTEIRIVCTDAPGDESVIGVWSTAAGATAVRCLRGNGMYGTTPSHSDLKEKVAPLWEGEAYVRRPHEIALGFTEDDKLEAEGWRRIRIREIPGATP